MSEPLTADELLERYPDEEFRERLLKLRYIANFLEDSIVTESYEVSQRMITPIALTTEGKALLKRIQSNTNPRNSCILAILLLLGWDELYVDPMKTNLEALAAQVSKEIVDGTIMHPYVLGRVLYDKAFDHLPRNKKILSHKETLQLLEDTPPGVFQLGTYVSGPFGLMASKSHRYAPPTLWVPLYHCDDFSCSQLHESYLSTAQAKVSKVRGRLMEIVDRGNTSPAEWGGFLKEQSSKHVNPFSWFYPSGLIFLLGDGFSLRELRWILADLLDETAGELRRRVAEVRSSVVKAAEFADGLDEAEALQLILLCSDEQIVDSINHLIITKKLKVPSSEVRSAKKGPDYSGYFRVTPVCSALGLRFDTDRSLTLLRTRHLISKLFDTSSSEEQERLVWLIRDMPGENLQEKLGEFISRQDLEQATTRLVFESRRSLEVSADFAGIGARTRKLLDEESRLTQAINWRLGVTDNASDDHFSDFLRHSDKLRHLAMRTHAYSAKDQEEILAITGNYFRNLERLLSDYIKLASWALLRDHYASPDGFVYHVEEARGFCASEIADRQEGFEFSEEGKWTLGPLAQSFGALAAKLGSLSGVDGKRSIAERPDVLRNPSPYSFLFDHKFPFLDLSDYSQEQIIAVLKEASSKLGRGRVAEVRNMTQHNSDKFPSQSEILGAVDAAQAVLTEAEEAGFLPIEAWPSGEERDHFGRRFVTLTTRRMKESRFVRPSQHYLAGLPPLRRPQLVIRAAIYKESEEVIRLEVRNQSDFTERWTGYPRRRKLGSSRPSEASGRVLES